MNDISATLYFTVDFCAVIVVSEALGLASITGPTPLTRQTVMRMPGPGELGINLAILRLSDMGKLDLNAPIAR